MKHCSIPTPLVQAYKIVRYTPFGEFTSLALPMFRYMHTKYVLGKWVYAQPPMTEHGYGLCIFRTIRHACEYLDLTVGPVRGWQLWRCEAINVRADLPPPLYTAHDASGNPDFSQIYEYPWPTGTLMADAVRLIEHIPWKEAFRHA
jgi:hypothetical protein